MLHNNATTTERNKVQKVKRTEMKSNSSTIDTQFLKEA